MSPPQLPHQLLIVAWSSPAVVVFVAAVNGVVVAAVNVVVVVVNVAVVDFSLLNYFYKMQNKLQRHA